MLSANMRQQAFMLIRKFGNSKSASIAYQKDLDFTNGSIELDIASPKRQTGFVGIAFHIQDSNHYETLYFRPGSSGTSEAIQYMPKRNRNSTGGIMKQHLGRQGHLPGHHGPRREARICLDHSPVTIRERMALACQDVLHNPTSRIPVLFGHILNGFTRTDNGPEIQGLIMVAVLYMKSNTHESLFAVWECNIQFNTAIGKIQHLLDRQYWADFEFPKNFLINIKACCLHIRREHNQGYLIFCVTQSEILIVE